ncbi:MAG: PPK2 family polyphosphate kinase, partial [Bacteroidota bacterium]
ASGKDGAVYKVFRDCSHNDVSTYGFKKPSKEELAHDFLWRIHKKVPGKGQIQIFNRSHYEDVLIQRVHGWIDEERVQKRMNSINTFEELLQYDNNTLILKFFLHISYDQQEEELQERLNEPDKNWKHNDGDWEQRKHWDKYMQCYQDVLNGSTIPWHIIPVDSRWYRDYLVSKTIVEAMEALDMSYPGLD